jgi:hypothetical protein
VKPHQLEEQLSKLKLNGMLETIEVRLAQASAGELGHVELIAARCADEAARRDSAGSSAASGRRASSSSLPSRTSTSPSTRRSPPPRSATSRLFAS